MDPPTVCRSSRSPWPEQLIGGLSTDPPLSSDARSVVELTTGTSDDGQEKANGYAPENNPQYTIVCVCTTVDLHHHFHELGAGVIEEYICIQRDKDFGFVRYNSHVEAARAIQLGNA
ncbi:oligouridylate-binding protein 1-like [Solanum tuberosum]|uniref:oligouridylate-binding protein 1-like n=1 Tax=Solanum tuberosum TaxID=4113 RepID=UPI00073A4155|nr:PREDICTED: oligouridylate-binding protein 1-like [Solanum tuberosum]